MVYKAYHAYCLVCPEDINAPGQRITAPFAPLVILQPGDPLTSRCIMSISHLGEMEQSGVDRLTPAPRVTGALAALVEAHGAIVLNPRFPRCWEVLEDFASAPKTGLRVTVLGLGDVGATTLLGLKLLGRELSEIKIFDLNQALCQRYEIEMNQLLSPDGSPRPRVAICREEELFDCDLFLFTATRGVPALGTQGDVRMLQYNANRDLLTHYARKARKAHFRGLFCQISDPVDQLCRVAFLESNRDDGGNLDFLGLAPEQVQGFGLGVMAARAEYAARELGLPTDTLRVYGPHGEGLICANAPGEGYDEELSLAITDSARTMNLRVRALGFKPYIAPGISSAAVSVLRMVRGEEYWGAVALDGVYFGCRGKLGRWGVEIGRENLSPQLLENIKSCYSKLKLRQ